MQFKQPVDNHITKITQSLLGVKKKKGEKKRASLPLQLQPSVIHVNEASVTTRLTGEKPNQPAHVTPAARPLIYIRLRVLFAERG